MALCCLPSMSFSLRSTLRWVGTSDQAQLDALGYGTILNWPPEVEARLVFAAQTFCRHLTRVWWKGCSNLLMALCCLPSMSFSLRSTLCCVGISAQASGPTWTLLATVPYWSGLLRWKQDWYLQPRPTKDTSGYGKDVVTLSWHSAACHPCHSAWGALCARVHLKTQLRHIYMYLLKIYLRHDRI